MHTCDPRAWEEEVGGSGVQSHFWLYEFKATLGNMRLRINKLQKKERTKAKQIYYYEKFINYKP